MTKTSQEALTGKVTLAIAVWAGLFSGAGATAWVSPRRSHATPLAGTNVGGDHQLMKKP